MEGKVGESVFFNKFPQRGKRSLRSFEADGQSVLNFPYFCGFYFSGFTRFSCYGSFIKFRELCSTLSRSRALHFARPCRSKNSEKLEKFNSAIFISLEKDFHPIPLLAKSYELPNSASFAPPVPRRVYNQSEEL